MASSWLQVLTVLVLATGSQPAAADPQHLCGSDLLDALILVCGDRGFIFNPKREAHHLLGFLPPKVGVATGGDRAAAPELGFQDHMEVLMKRGIMEQCCHKPCNIFDLENYCDRPLA
ncbi:insulin isoform X3 [Hippocampus comes]|nr:PREDICTED: insulin-like isoform X3 [Hippocampus comes]XP_019747545.1 PREDICTED: insulin-like isoform X3 [Hippocampus comes]